MHLHAKASKDGAEQRELGLKRRLRLKQCASIIGIQLAPEQEPRAAWRAHPAAEGHTIIDGQHEDGAKLELSIRSLHDTLHHIQEEHRGEVRSLGKAHVNQERSYSLAHLNLCGETVQHGKHQPHQLRWDAQLQQHQRQHPTVWQMSTSVSPPCSLEFHSRHHRWQLGIRHLPTTVDGIVCLNQIKECRPSAKSKLLAAVQYKAQAPRGITCATPRREAVLYLEAMHGECLLQSDADDERDELDKRLEQHERAEVGRVVSVLARLRYAAQLAKEPARVRAFVHPELVDGGAQVFEALLDLGAGGELWILPTEQGTICLWRLTRPPWDCACLGGV